MWLPAACKEGARSQAIRGPPHLSSKLACAVLTASSVLSAVLPSFLHPTRLGGRKSLVLGLTLGFSLSLSLTGLAMYAQDAWKRSMIRRGEAQKRMGVKRNEQGDDDDGNDDEMSKNMVEIRGEDVVHGVEGLIGKCIPSPQPACGKCEFLNPFGSVKDRVSLRIIKQAEDQGLIVPNTGSCIFEGTSGSTGISIAGIARARGYQAHIVVPDDVAAEKVQLLEALGAVVEKVRPVSIVDKRHYVNLARLRAQQFGQRVLHASTSSDSTSSAPSNNNSNEDLSKITAAPSSRPRPSEPSLLITSQPNPTAYNTSSSASTTYTPPARGLFADQFENLSNLQAHSHGTAAEIWKQTKGEVDAFVSGAGTGGTIAGVGKTLKGHKKGVMIVLADPQGSGLFHKVHDGVLYSTTEAEGTRRRYQIDTVVEGIGLNRLTRNFEKALPLIDDAFRVTDEEAITMSRHVAKQDGLFLGSSSAVNLVTCVRLAQKWKKEGQQHDKRARREQGEAGKKMVVTILCDSGTRHYSRFWNDKVLQDLGYCTDLSIDTILEPTTAAS
ncbi:BQ2448_1326 [Microbotryum intermedium]|uniref:cysteine synthase n=1 Tax=Microbotryum intermedium TaxID=269621 RepID=A0A238F7T5_9BASI|nr:BQ2448_1326 [Microbotryum intermedium]